MDVDKQRTLSLIGAGKLASHVAYAFHSKGFKFLQVFNRTTERGIQLASLLNCEYINDIKDLKIDADIYLIALADSAIEEFTRQLYFGNKPVIIFSGTLDIKVLASVSNLYGVIYPPQTFSGEIPVNFENIPLCIEGHNEESENEIHALACTISSQVIRVSLEQRRILHVSAVFASNFTNFLFSFAEDLLEKNGLPHKLLAPLAEKTASNFTRNHIFGLQTGPAIREDKAVIQLHEQILRNYPEYLKIYQILTRGIIQKKHENG